MPMRPPRPGVAVILALGLAAGGCAAAISTQDEVALGAQQAAQINAQLPLVDDPALVGYLNSVGRRLAAVGDPRNIPYRFYLVNSAAVNALSLPGGYVYVTRGLIERADRFDEFAGVLGHEIAHIARRHAIAQLARAERANLLLNVVYGVLLQRPPSTIEQVGIAVGGEAVFAGYSRDQEREADTLSVHTLLRAGIDPRGVPRLFETLLAEGDRAPSGVAGWFATHPGARERLELVNRVVARIPPERLRNLTSQSAEYVTFRNRVQALPPPPRR